MTLQISASKSELVLQCARPFEEGITTDDEAGEPARYGSAFHSMMEAKSSRVEVLLPLAIKLERVWSIPGASDELVGHVRASKKLLKKWMTGENPWSVNFSAGRVEKEIAFAINPSELTCRRIDLPSVEDHIYHDVDQRVEIPGTVDLMSDFPLVMDYKTGRDPFDFFTIPEDVTQLRTLGLAVWLENALAGDASGPEEVILAVLHAPRGSVPAIYADAVPVADLRKHAQRLALALERKGDGSLRAGPACRLCPARYDCVTQTGAYLKRAGEALELARPAGEFLKDIVEYGPRDLVLATGEDVGRLHYFREQFRKLDASSGALMKQWVIDHPEEIAIRPQDGKLLVIKEKSQENLSKASIIRALGKARGEALIQELRDNGVIETSERVELHAVDDK